MDSGATCCVTVPLEPLHITMEFRVSNAPSPIILEGLHEQLYRRGVQQEATEDMCGRKVASESTSCVGCLFASSQDYAVGCLWSSFTIVEGSRDLLRRSQVDC